jgi:hypothetical protein
MSVFEIASFLDVPAARATAELAVASKIGSEVLAAVYDWSSEDIAGAGGPAGAGAGASSPGTLVRSDFVRRQCVRWLRRNFAELCESPHLINTPEPLLVEVLESDFLQAREVVVLNGYLRWCLGRAAVEMLPDAGPMATFHKLVERHIGLVRFPFIRANDPSLVSAEGSGLVPEALRTEASVFQSARFVCDGKMPPGCCLQPFIHTRFLIWVIL